MLCYAKRKPNHADCDDVPAEHTVSKDEVSSFQVLAKAKFLLSLKKETENKQGSLHLYRCLQIGQETADAVQSVGRKAEIAAEALVQSVQRE